MKKTTLFILLTLFFSECIFASNHTIDIQHWNLSNKTHVYFVRRTELPMLDVELIFSAGSSRDDNLPGLAALTNAMIGEGAKDFENGGALFRTFINRDMAGAMLRTSTNPEYLNISLQNFKTVLSTPTFSETDLNRVKQQLLSQLKSQNQDPSQVATNAFYHALYQHYFYAHNPLGNEQSVSALTQHQLIDFYKQYYVGANANLILVGDITLSQAKEMSEKIAGNLSEGKSALALPLAENTISPALKVIHYPSSQSTVVIGQVGITRENPDYYALILGNAILGGLPMSSILYDEIREKRGLVYTVSSGFDPLQYRGPFMIYLQTKSSTADEANELVKKLLRKFIDEGPTLSQLNAAKRNMIAGFPLSLSSNSAILTVVSHIAFYHRPLNYIEQYEKNMNAVTSADVKLAFQKNINVNKLTTVIVGENK